jgi:HEAT repeat protein
MIHRQHSVTQDQIEEGLTKLGSRDESDVLEAKNELIGMGEAAIKPLITLLQDLTNQEGNPPGRAPDGNSVSELRKQVENDNQSVDPETKSKLENNIYELLGRLHAADAVPQLIDSIERAKSIASNLAELRTSDLTEEARQRRLGRRQGTIELRATLVLREIGDQRAIPALEELQTTSDNQFIVTQAREAVLRIQNKGGQ